jgi:glycosyltransferase involved in cell wall biosynthesis
VSKALGEFAATGGFAHQVKAIAWLFDATRVALPVPSETAPENLTPISGPGISVVPLSEPAGHGWLRKLAVLPWTLRNGAAIARELRAADAVHTPVPGDVGAITLLMTLLQKKPLFVRHCGTWGDRSTIANRFMAWLLPRIAGGRVVVMATGGGPEPPDPGNAAIEWIFATSLSEAEYEELAPAEPWVPSSPLRLVTVGRVTRGKNALACVEALPRIRRAAPEARLTVVGDGPFKGELSRRAAELGVADVIELTGNLTHDAVMEVLRYSHLFLFPTRVAEGFPKAVLEAMASGLPVVASRVSVLPHLLGDGHGVLLDGSRAADVADAALDLIADPGRMAAIGAKARARAADYTLERWRDLIGERLERAWGRPLRGSSSDQPVDRERAS